VTLHDDEFSIDDALVRSLVDDQLPHLRGLALRRIETAGTVHVVFRLGDELVVRLPRHGAYSDGPQREAACLPRFIGALPITVPKYHALGRPSSDYPAHWSVLEWIEGVIADRSTIDDLGRAAADLGAFIAAMRCVSTDGAPAGGSDRRLGLDHVDGDFRRWLARLPEDIDRATVLRIWNACLSVGEWDGPPMWLHGDLRGDNLLVRDGELAAVIDWEGCSVGDPSADLLAAWWLFDADSRDRFRSSTGVGDAEWMRARGWALFMAVAAIPYYADSHPSFSTQARAALGEVIADEA
jgi:aminoglycoside phosphotransferase (APT) family kinase protein